MKINKKNIFIIILISVFLFSCQTAKEALQGKKRSDTSDEFLVEKKNPLVMPPDIENLPEPGVNEEVLKFEDEESEIKNLLKIGENDNSSTDLSESIENSVLKKIK
tara:strand:+ start:467 stop:784 length:318 start_codon:yes stop_codon:yes gene_type:complete